MTVSWPTVNLGGILTERRESPDSSALANGTVRIISKISFDLGNIVLRPGFGTRTGMILVQPGDLVVSGINAAKGAIAVYEQANTEPVAATIHYSAYEVDTRQTTARYLWWYLRSQRFRDILVRSLPNGIKTEVRASRLLALQIPLPPLEEQRRLVDSLETFATQIGRARQLLGSVTAEIDTLNWNTRARTFANPSGERVGDFVRFQTGFAFKSDWFSAEGVRLVRNTNIGHGRLDWTETVRIPDSRNEEFQQFQLREDDILISLDRPIISTGIKVARVCREDLPALLLQRVARAIIDESRLNRDYFFHWLNSPAFVGSIDPGRSNGVPHISHKDVERIPFAAPSLREQARAVKYLESYRVAADSLRRLEAQCALDLEVLLPAILDRTLPG